MRFFLFFIFGILFGSVHGLCLQFYVPLTLPQVKNYQYQPRTYGMHTLKIDKYGNIWMGGEQLERFSQLAERLKERKEEWRPGQKIYLLADQETPYGKIVEIFKALSIMKIKTVGLITDENAAYGDFIHQMEIFKLKR